MSGELQKIEAIERLTMSSRAIAEICEKDHRNVLADIRDMLNQLYGEGGMLKFQQTYINAQNGQSYPEYHLPKRESIILVSGYKLEYRARIIDRWQELERRAQFGGFDIPPDYPGALRLAADLAEDKRRLENKVAALEPKADAHDRLIDAEGAMCITRAAKALQIQPSKLFRHLREKRWIYRRAGSTQDTAFQDRIQGGWLTHKVYVAKREDGTEKVCEQVMVTPRGLAKLAKDLGTSVQQDLPAIA